jgi:rhodanese-related sulfurtransferase
VGEPRLDHHRRTEPLRIELEQYQIGHAAVEPVGDALDLVGERQMNKALVVQELAFIILDHPDQSAQTGSQYGSAVAEAQPSRTSNGNTSSGEVRHSLSLPRPKPSNGRGGRLSLEGLISGATAQITRFSAPEAFSASVADGLIIDIRSQDARKLSGVVPGSLHIPRTVLEWRIALDSPWRNVHLGGIDLRLILVCDHGYSSILAASNLVQLGFYRAGDVIGGFEAWKDMGLPIEPCRPGLGSVDRLPGTGPPE